jgi:hypothetical protein
MKKLLAILTMLAPLTVMASDDVCTKLISDITRNYELSKLEFMPNGNPHISQSMVSCTYSGFAPSMSGDLPVVITALLNTTNNRYTLEVH